MSDERKKLYQGKVSHAIAERSYCGSPDNEVLFVAPIDLLPDDELFIDPRSGQPLAVYRERRKIWEFKGEYLTGSVSMSLTVDNDVLAQLLGKLAP